MRKQISIKSFGLLLVLLTHAGLWAQAPRLSYVKLVPPTIQGGGTVNVHIGLDRPGIAIPIVNSSNQNVAPFKGPAPNSQNKPIIFRSITTREVTAQVRVTISATWGGRTRSATLTVNPPPPPPLPPTLVSPADNAIDATGRPLFQWNAVSGATSYTLFICRGSVLCDRNSSGEGFFVPSIQATQVRWPSVLPYRGEVVRWHVQAVNENGTSDISARRNLTLLLPAATLVSPPNDAILNTRRPLFRWQAVPGATQYRINITGGNNQVAQFTVNDGSATTFQPSQDIYFGGLVRWSVLARNAATGFGATENPSQLFRLRLPQ